VKEFHFEKSIALREKARSLIPSMTQTFSKGPAQFVQGVSPVFLARGKGSHVWDVDGNEFIDYVTALGPVILGYDWPSVTEAVIKQVRNGAAFSLPHPLEVELAELLVEIIPCAEMVRYGKNGSDATSAAVRVARAFTGRDKIACCGYHGWHDWFVGTTTRALGVPQATRPLTLTFQYNDLRSLERLFDEHHREIAAVIMEPVGVVEPENDFLAAVKELAHRHGAVLIFDEIVTGFRLGIGGAQMHYGVTPDLACFGKAMANGFPLSAVVGRREIMELFDEVFVSFTFGGEAIALAAAVATINELRSEDVYRHLWNQGRKLQDGFNRFAAQSGLAGYCHCTGLPPHTVMSFTASESADPLVLRSLLQQELIKRGILHLTGINTCYGHSDQDVDVTLTAYEKALAVLSNAIRSGDPRAFLLGEPVQPVFRKP
jgi:glutamate-1-semialdehyde 2,1-aminomutase/spore coat polysaccharide biosynthesis protein SpsF